MNVKLEQDSAKGGTMLLGIENAAAYLVARGLIDARSIVEGDLKIVDMSRRNRNLQILRHNDASLLLKQPGSAGANNSIAAIKKEALLYLLMQTDADFTALKEIAPRILDFDDRENVMVTEFIDKAKSWNEHNYYSSASAEPVSKEESAELGRMMAAYHKAFSGFADSPKLHFLQGGFVPAASVVRPGPEIFTEISGANLKLLRVIQQYPTFYDSLEELYSGWRRQTLIHGDIKWDNVIISPGDKNAFRLNIVDWESASIGDPAWDIGSVFQEFIRFWLTFLPATGRESAEQLAASTTHPIKELQPSIRSFWNTYTQQCGMGAKEANELLVRSAKFCAARLVQTAYESLFSSTDLSNMVVYMIQTSMNIFNRTNQAILQLLGIPFRSEW